MAQPTTPIQKISQTPTWVVLSVAALLRVAMFPFANLSAPTLWEYGVIARNMLLGNGYAYNWWSTAASKHIALPSAFMPPGQVAIQFTALGLFGDNLAGYIALFLIQVIFGVVFTYAMGKIVELLFRNAEMTKLAMWLAAIYPTFVFATTSFGVLDVVLMLNALLIWSALALSAKIHSGGSIVKESIVFGLLGGLLGFFRSESPMVVICTMFLIAYRNRDILKRRFAQFAIAAVAMLAVLTPWIVRNYSVFHELIPSSSSGPMNFWRGHSEHATGSSFLPNGESIWTTDSMYAAIEPDGIPDTSTELHYAKFHSEEAWKWISANPGTEISRTFKKFILLWGIDWYYPGAANPAYIALYVVTFAMLLYGVRELRRAKRNDVTRLSRTAKDGLAIVTLWTAMFTLTAMAFFSLPRFQILMIGIYFPVVIYGVHNLLRPKVAEVSNPQVRSVVSPAKPQKKILTVS